MDRFFGWLVRTDGNPLSFNRLHPCMPYDTNPHTRTPLLSPPALFIAAAYYPPAFACFMICSYATSSCFISVLTAYRDYVIWFITAFKLFITTRISGMTSTFVFSISTPLTSRQHFLVSSSFEILSMTNSFSRFSSSSSRSFWTSTCAS